MHKRSENFVHSWQRKPLVISQAGSYEYWRLWSHFQNWSISSQICQIGWNFSFAQSCYCQMPLRLDYRLKFCSRWSDFCDDLGRSATAYSTLLIPSYQHHSLLRLRWPALFQFISGPDTPFLPLDTHVAHLSLIYSTGSFVWSLQKPTSERAVRSYGKDWRLWG